METKYASNTAVNVRAQQEASTIFLAKVFNWMAGGLALTGVVAWFTANTNLAYIMASSGVYWLLFLAEIGLVVYLSARIEKIRANTATALFVVYAALNGLTFSMIFLSYTGTSIAATFMITAGMFGAMAVYGLVTKKDLSGVGSFMFMGLVGLILASVVNMFLGSSTLHLAISAVGVLVFVGLTAYDVQRIKNIGEQGIMQQGDDVVQKGAITGALALYLDFINLFIMLLSFFGGGRD
ncbi:Bax inhibitor-1/YccA family protein [Candidatus Electrothrix sp.]|uniref:Bax inhibitor-1/YccA family protein n=1 Tax=Candidatus Electrothrix sp. TaxID=2170559 RepID=UPI004056F86D